jgi:signal transduction histidine kinase
MKRRHNHLLSQADWSRVKGSHEVMKAKVTATVLRVVGLGAICRVGGPRIIGVVRNRELSWNVEDQRSDFVHEGQSFEALVIGYDDDRRELVLSRKAASPNPLLQFQEKHSPGSIVEGRIIKRLPNLDFLLALEGGLEGYLPNATVPAFKTGPELIQTLELRLGDHISARVVLVNRETGHVQVEFRGAWEKSEADFSAKWAREPSRPPTVRPGRARPAPAPRPERSLSVLLVEDDDMCAEPVEFFLRQRGHRVRRARDLAGAMKLVQQPETVDVAVVDLQLNGESGDSFINVLRAAHPHARLLLYTGNPQHADYSNTRLVNEVILKPKAPLELIAHIEAPLAASGSTTSGMTESVAVLLGDPDAEQALGQAQPVFTTHLRMLKEVYPRASMAILSWNASLPEVRCLQTMDCSPAVFQKAAQRLTFSPIEQVLVDERPMRITLARLSNATHGFSALMADLKATHLIGHPLRLQSDTAPLGVFTFLPDGHDPPNTEQLLRSELVFEALTMTLDRHLHEAHMLRQQRALCAGGMLLGMTHELANCTSAMLGQMALLRTSLAPDSQTSPTARLERVDRLEARVGGLMCTFENMLNMVKPRTDTATLPVGEILVDVVNATEEVSKATNVRISVSPLAPDLAARPVPVLIQQALLNLVLNAVQHTGSYRIANSLGHGFVELNAGVADTDGSGNKLIFQVKDNGPGINGADFERIFSMYHSTRKRGSGLGLHVTRSIAASAGGDVIVERSLKFHETVMILRIPASSLC